MALDVMVNAENHPVAEDLENVVEFVEENPVQNLDLDNLLLYLNIYNNKIKWNQKLLILMNVSLIVLLNK